VLGIIGGSGMGALENMAVKRRGSVRTPFGKPSGALAFGTLGGREVVFLPRHGPAHTIPPHEVNYRANIWALHARGVTDVVAVAAGWIGVKQVLPITDSDFRYGAQYFWRPFDAYYSLIKAVSFGLAIGIISCYMGYNTQQGAEGVGRSTTAAVVASSVTILLLNMLLARILLHS